jgi:Ni,Fe-hydrogenase III large subunit
VSYSLILQPSTAAWHGERLVLRLDDEQIVDLEYRPAAADGSFAAGLLQQTPIAALRRVAVESCPHCAVAHSLALCHAFEMIAEADAPPRAVAMRTILAEMERAVSHLQALHAVMSALLLSEPAAEIRTLARALQQGLRELLASAPAPYIIPGGLAAEPALLAVSTAGAAVRKALPAVITLAERLIARSTLISRTVDVGYLSPAAARQFRLSGPLARASGQRSDVRVDRPYAAYGALPPALIVEEGGDVHARGVVLLLETVESLRMADRWLAALPLGAVAVDVELPADGTALSAVEAPRGELTYQVDLRNGVLERLRIRPAPQLDRLLARTMFQRAEADDALLIAVSTDPCSACQRAASI